MRAGQQTRRVVEFASGVGWEDFPADVREQAARCVLDLVGNAVAGSRTEVARTTGQYAQEDHGPGAATVICADATSTPVGAALANGFAASALDLDDGYRPVKGHPGAVVFPAVLAAAEQAGSTGAEFLTALVVGYEVAIRAGLALHSFYGFYHGTGSWGAIGAAAGAARLLCTDKEQIGHALGIADFHAPITPEMRSVDSPSMVKDGIGWGAMAGLASAQLASRGFTGIPSLFDAERSGTSLVDGLGDEYLFRRLYFKPHACCRWAQPAVEGALEAIRELGVGSADVTRVRVYTFEAAMHLRVTAPRSTEEAQFSLPWPVACALIDGAAGAEQMLEPALADSSRRALARRVETVHDGELEEAFPERTLARVEVTSTDGRSADSGIMAAWGDAESPLTDAELTGKFRGLCEPVLDANGSEEVLSAIRALPDASDLSALCTPLAARSSAAKHSAESRMARAG